ncbi:MAG: methylmalonyl-CoA carboxyltransferase, partial [Treponema sp.]|nr:methylmalonyl-CoA carboxyltransferase [Treponema sp.]
EVAAKEQAYREEIMTPAIAAKRGYVTEVIEPSATRRHIAESLSFLADKKSMDNPLKKHGNIPL